MATTAELLIKADSRQVKTAAKDLKNLSDTSAKTERTTKSLSTSFKFLGSAISAIGAASFVRGISKASISLEAINSSLIVATGSTQAATKEFEFIRGEANRLGLELQSSADAYASLAAASKGTALEGQGARDIFVAVSEAMTALGRDAYATEGALRAIEQMISKGNVQAEELRGQLGERLPGAFQLAAKSMGVTTQQLNDMLGNGEVLAADLLPRLAQELSNTFGAQAEAKAQGLAAEINRFRTAVFELMSSGNMEGLSSAVRDFTSLISDPNFQQSFGNLLSGITKLAEYSGKSAASFADFGVWVGESVARLQGYEDAADRVVSLQEELSNAEYRLSRARKGTNTDALKERIELLKSEIKIYKELSDVAPVTQPDMSITSSVTYSPIVNPAKADLGDVIKIGGQEQITQVDLIKQRYDELFGIAERLNQELRTPVEIYNDEIELLNELKNTRIEGSDESLLSYENYVRGVQAAQDRLEQATQETTDEITTFWTKAAENIQDELADNLFDFMQGQFDFTADGFKRMIDRMVADALAAELGEALFGAVGANGKNSGGGLVDKGIGFLSNLFSFDGGGYTGDSSRSGGLDGKGGFLAMMHPKETVIDHTKGQSNSVNVTINVSGVADTGGLQRTAAQIAQQSGIAAQRALARNG